MAQLMPLPVTVSCFSKIQIGFTFLVPAHLGSPGERVVKHVCVCSGTTCVSWYQKGKTSLDLNEVTDDGVLGWQWHQLDHMQTICTSLETDQIPHQHLITQFYRPDALPDAQSTVSKH